MRWVFCGGGTAEDAREALEVLKSSDRPEFWPHALPFREVALRGAVGLRQVIDAYLASLARSRGGRLATLDRALAYLHADVAVQVDFPG